MILRLGGYEKKRICLSGKDLLAVAIFNFTILRLNTENLRDLWIENE
jgi:hypothetical protein